MHDIAAPGSPRSPQCAAEQRTLSGAPSLVSSVSTPMAGQTQTARGIKSGRRPELSAFDSAPCSKSHARMVGRERGARVHAPDLDSLKRSCTETKPRGVQGMAGSVRLFDHPVLSTWACLGARKLSCRSSGGSEESGCEGRRGSAQSNLESASQSSKLP